MARTIAVVGTHCTRKTTAVSHLAAAASAAGLQFVLVPEVARTSPLTINEGSTAAAQLWIATTQLAREVEAADTAPLLLTDGALVNDYAYLLRAAGGDPFGLAELVARWTAATAAFLFLRPDVPAVADGVRSTDETFRRDIDARLSALLGELARPGSVTEMPASAVIPEVEWGAILSRLMGA